MNTIFLETLRLLNFKGVRELTVNFTQRTDICGDNGIGKTTVLDAFTYLLFGKNSEDKADFNIKTLDASNRPIHKLDHEVEGVLLLNNMKVTLKKVYKEKWTKRKGSETAEMTGHTTDYFYNEIPLNQSEYQEKISAIINEQQFKIITSTSYFNAMKWQDRRLILTEMAGTVKDETILNSSERFKALAGALSDRTIEEYKKQIAGQIKKLKESIEEIPARISEANRTMPEKLDYDEILKLGEQKKAKLEEIEKQLDSEVEKANALNKKNETLQTEIYKLKGEISDLEHKTKLDNIEAKQKATGTIQELKGAIEIKERTIDNIIVANADYKRELERLNGLREDLIKQWEEQSGRTMDAEAEFTCPVSKRPCPDTELVSSKMDEVVAAFNAEVSKAKEAINKRGLEVKGDILVMTKKIEEGEANLKDKKAELEQMKAELTTLQANQTEVKEVNYQETDKFKELQAKITELEAQKTDVIVASNEDLKQQKRDIAVEIDALRDQYRTKELREKLEIRIRELSESESGISKEIAKLEGIEFTIAAFEKAKIDTITEKVNSMFDYVEFKMFTKLLNGGFEPTCQTMVNGVPYSDLNTAGRINAGIAIINTLSKHYDTFAPVFADEANLVNKFIETESQFIRLLVTGDKELKIINN
jgi:DNA repair protein SbcC/Rad50